MSLISVEQGEHPLGRAGFPALLPALELDCLDVEAVVPGLVEIVPVEHFLELGDKELIVLFWVVVILPPANCNLIIAGVENQLNFLLSARDR
jgi:hypothetical protein